MSKVKHYDRGMIMGGDFLNVQNIFRMPEKLHICLKIFYTLALVLAFLVHTLNGLFCGVRYHFTKEVCVQFPICDTHLLLVCLPIKEAS